MFVFDIETLGIESTSVVLSAAIVHFDPSESVTYQELLDRALFVKFDAKIQVSNGRTIDSSTLAWWEKQSSLAKSKSLIPDRNIDVSPEVGLNSLRSYYNNPNIGNKLVWTRGPLDQIVSESLAKSFKLEPFAPYWAYRDVRTAIDLTKDSNNGYCEVEGFSDSAVVKHDPIHDVAYDALMLLYGK